MKSVVNGQQGTEAGVAVTVSNVSLALILDLFYVSFYASRPPPCCDTRLHPISEIIIPTSPDLI